MGASNSSSVAARLKIRIEKQLKDIQQNPPMNWKIIRQSDDLWDVWITTDIQTPFHSIPFKVIVQFPSDYPNSLPNIKFQNHKRFFHPNIHPQSGYICERTVFYKNQAQITIRQRIDILINLLGVPNPFSHLNPEAAKMCEKDYHQYYSYALQKFRGK